MKLLPLLTILLFVASITKAQFSIQQYTTLKNPEASVSSADGQFLYASHARGLTVCSISPSSKTLKTVQTIALEGGCQDALITPDQQFILAASFEDNAILIYKRATNGQLNPYKTYKNVIDGTRFQQPTALVLSPSGNYLFFNSDRTLFTFRFRAGQLEYITQSTLTRNYHGRVYFSPDNQHVFINNYEEDGSCPLPILTLNEQTGLLETVGCIEEEAYFIPNSYWDFFGERKQHHVKAILDYMSFSPDGKDVYMDGYETSENGGSSSILHYRWINGQLKLQDAYYQLDKKYKINSTKNMYLDGNGDYLYLLIGGSDSGVFIFKRNPSTGALSFVRAFYKVENLPKLVSPHKISFSPDNQAAFISNYFGGNIMVLKNQVGQPSPQKKLLVAPSPPAPVGDYSNNTTNQHSNSNPNNSSSNSNCQFPSLQAAELAPLEQQFQNLPTEQAGYDYLLKELQNKCLQTVQVMRLARLLEVEYLRLEFVKFAYYYTTDLEHYYLLDSLFTSTRLKTAFKKYLEE